MQTKEIMQNFYLSGGGGKGFPCNFLCSFTQIMIIQKAESAC